MDAPLGGLFRRRGGGSVYGPELHIAKEQLRGADLAELEVEDEHSGETTRASLPL